MTEMENLHKLFEEKITKQMEINYKNLEEKSKENILNLDIPKLNVEKKNISINENEILNKIQEELNSHEENFEKIQNNFVTLNSNMTQLQENQKIFNDIIENLKDNYNKLNIKIDEHIKEINLWQNNILQQINQNLKSLKEQYEDKIIQLEKKMNPKDLIKIEKDDSIQNLTRNKNKNNIKKEEIKQIENSIEKSKGNENDNNENFNNENDNNDNYNSDNINNENFNENSNNENNINENNNNENILSENDEIGFREHTHGYINNIIEDFSILNDNLEKEKINFNNNNEIQFKSINNNIPKTNIIEKDDEKLQKNEVYVRSSITELVEYKDNEIFVNYLKKFMTPMKNFESEIEFNINEGQNDKNDDDNEQNGIDSNNMYRVEENYDDDIDDLN